MDKTKKEEIARIAGTYPYYNRLIKAWMMSFRSGVHYYQVYIDKNQSAVEIVNHYLNKKKEILQGEGN